MIALVNGEKLPEPAPPQWDGPNLEDAFNPFWLFFAFIVSAMLRGALGRLLGSVATGAFVTALAWFLVGSLGIALAAGLLAFIIAIFLDLVPSSGGSPGGGTWSTGSSSSGGWSSGSSSDSGSFSGGGGSFGGGGASGSW